MNNENTNLIIQALGSIKKGNKNNPISLHEPNFNQSNAIKYVNECINTGWVSSAGKYVEEFEKKLCDFTKAKFCIAVNNGTVGLRLGLHILGVRHNDEVLIPCLSFVATANAVSHLGAHPHFIDIEEKTLGMCPLALKKRLEEIGEIKKGILYNKFTGRRIAAIIPVHIFGNPTDINLFNTISKKWDLPILEDSAEALGSWFIKQEKKVHCGLMGDLGVISFNGNKIITTGGGGALITNNKKYADLARHISKTAKIPHAWEFNHDMIGWNDRMPNINAALGVSQIEKIDIFLKKKKKLYIKYVDLFSNINDVEIFKPSNLSISNNWLITMKFTNRDLNEAKKNINNLLEESHKIGLLLRPAWQPLHTLKIYKNNQKGIIKKGEDLSFRLVNLPSSPFLVI